MSASPLQLYADALFVSPYAMAVFVALREKGIAFEIRTLDLDRGEHLAGEFARRAVTRRVPALVQGEFVLSESSAIIEYLEDLYPDVPVLPVEVGLRARARQVQAWLRSDLLPIRQERSTLVLFYGKQYGPLTADGEAAAEKLIAAAEVLLPDGAEYLCGAWSIADVELAAMLNRLILNGDPVPERLKWYAARQWQRAAVQEWVGMSRPAL